MNPETKTIRIALAGNPNSGKTSIFNLLTGMNQQVGNWPGVTVERKSGSVSYRGYHLEIVDLPGTYSLTSYTIEERVARQYILEEQPDVIINVLDSANLARNLHLTTQLLEMGVDVIIDLNMWDEFTHAGATLDLKRFEELLGTPAVTTIGHRGQGREALLDAVIRLIEDRSVRHRHVPIAFGPAVDDVLVALTEEIAPARPGNLSAPPRYLATKLLEGDPHIVEIVHNHLPDAPALLHLTEAHREHIRKTTGLEASRVISEGRYGYIDGLLRETATSAPLDRMELSRQLDRFLTHRLLGLPIFLAFVWLLFNGTFTLGAYPMAGIEALVGLLQDGLVKLLPAGFVTDLLVHGILGGVGSVAVFIPPIMLLFLGIALLEDSGYMARVAFIMDRVMHLFGLHGKSFIPMLMGFGCTVPAIMGTRTLESQRDRILTTLLVPHMSCAARFPVYILFAGAFFPKQAGNVVTLIYILGVLTALCMGFVFSRTLFRKTEASFVMELPPYRWPTTRGLFAHMWGRVWVYIKKMGTLILIASGILWILGSYPQLPDARVHTARIAQLAAEGADAAQLERLERELAVAEVEYAIIGRLGRIVEPVIRPLGFDWRMGISLLTGFVAKEVVVSTMGVLYHAEDEEHALRAALANPRSGITPLTAVGFMVFVLLYTPCIAAVAAVRREIGARWMWFDVAYQLALAWGMAFIVYQGGRLLGLG